MKWISREYADNYLWTLWTLNCVDFVLFFSIDTFNVVYNQALSNLKKFSQISRKHDHNFINLVILLRNFLHPEVSWSQKVYLTGINFSKIHDDLIACLEVLRHASWPQNVKVSVKIHFFVFSTTWKICFWINNKFEK